MDPKLLLKVLGRRRELAARDGWSPSQVRTYQARRLAALRDHSQLRSRFYREFHRGLTRAPLAELPILTKAVLMDRFDDLITRGDLRLADARAHLAAGAGAQRLLGRYYVAATAGTTGEPGIFVWDVEEWAEVLASYSRAYGWAGASVRLTGRTRMAVVSSTVPSHQSALVGASVDSRFVPTLRVDSGDPLEDVVRRLNDFRPDVLVGYASMLGLLAGEQRAGRLHVQPGAVLSASEVLTAEARRDVEQAWNRRPFDVYAATETAGIAAECGQHAGLHLFEDLVITEVVDDEGRPVTPGEYGSRLLVTVLGSRTLPLIRYELSDSVRMLPGPPCPCGRPFLRIGGVQGRAEEALRLPAARGGDILVQPNVIHRAMELLPLTGWQVVLDDTGITIHITGLAERVDTGQVARRLADTLALAGAVAPTVRAVRVPAVSRTALGKAPLIRSVRGCGEHPGRGRGEAADTD